MTVCAAQLDALAKALVALAPTPPERPFIWLDRGRLRARAGQFYDLGPVLSPRVKHAFVVRRSGGGDARRVAVYLRLARPSPRC